MKANPNNKFTPRIGNNRKPHNKAAARLRKLAGTISKRKNRE